MNVNVLTDDPGTAPGFLFLDPYASGSPQGQNGSLIMDNAGNPIWFRALPTLTHFDIDFRVQTYLNQSVLTWWEGIIAGTPGHDNLPSPEPEPGAQYFIYDDHYQLVRVVTAKNGWTADQHEFLLTPDGNALFTVFRRVPMDLRQYGGPADGAIGDYGVQEIDLQTGELLFSWDILEHVSLAQSHIPASNAETANGHVWDAYHINSLDLGSNNQLLVSSRNTWAVFDLDMTNGNILWQLGGRDSDFSFPETNATFYWQHMVRFQSDNVISMFGDGCCEDPKDPEPEQESHGLFIQLDFDNMTAAEVKSYFHDPALQASSEGSTDVLSNGDVLIGWGDTGYVSEYTSSGNSQGDGTQSLLYDVQFPGSEKTYRAFRSDWTGTPSYPPSEALRSNGGGTDVYASWNGSTETTAWRVLAGPSKDALSPASADVSRTGFETVVQVDSAGPYFQVQALGSDGQVLGASPVQKVR